MGEAIQELHHEHGVSEERLQGVLPPSWVRWALEPQEGRKRKTPTCGGRTSCTRCGESTTPRKAQHKLGKVINQVQLAKFMESLDSLPEEIVPPTVDDPFGGCESKDVALARVRSSQGPGAHAFFGAAPTDRAREIPPNEVVYATRQALGIEQFLAPGCPRCHRSRDGGTITTMHARTCPRDGAQVTMHEPLKHALSRALRGLRVRATRRRKWGTIYRGEKSLHGHRRPTRISNQRIVTGVPPQGHPPRCHPRRSASASALAKRQRDWRWNRNPNLRGAKAPALRSSGTRVL